MNGFISIIKPANMSSALCVALVKKKIKAQFNKQSIGHMGTLDPMAEGVLPMGINQANRLFNYNTTRNFTINYLFITFI